MMMVWRGTRLRRWRQNWLHIPNGCDVRLGIGWLLVAFGLIRLLNLPVAGDVTFDWMVQTPHWVLPGIKMALGLALLATADGTRLRPVGRAVAVLACAYCCILVRASAPSANGMLVYGAFALSLLAEGAERHECR
jgi:hypothetical protein